MAQFTYFFEGLLLKFLGGGGEGQINLVNTKEFYLIFMIFRESKNMFYPRDTTMGQAEPDPLWYLLR